MPISEQELNQRVARAQNVIIPAAERAGRCRTPAQRTALTKLIREVQGGDASVKNLTELAEWTAPLLEQAPSVPPAPKGLLEDLAKLDHSEFLHVLGESQLATRSWQRPAPAAVSESAATPARRTREAIEADWARSYKLPATEARELQDQLIREHAASVSFGGRRLAES